MKTLTIETTNNYPLPHLSIDTEVVEFDALIDRLSDEDYKILCEETGGEDKVTAESLAIWYSSFMSVECWVNNEGEIR